MAESGIGQSRAALFRLEFGGANGWGHLVRCGVLAGELRRRGWRCDLWTGSAIDAVPAELREPFDRVIPQEVRGAMPTGYDWLVVDHYGTGDDMLASWRDTFAGRILAIDDEAKRRLAAADLVLNVRPGLDTSRYPAGVATLLGEQYALLRPGLRAPLTPSWRASAGITPVFVMLGGTDPAGATETVLEALADVDAAGLAPIVVRSGLVRPRALARFASAVWLDGVNACELAGWAGLCRFAISAAGGTLYELAFLRVPFVSVVVAANQRDFAAEVETRLGMPRVHAGPALRSELAAAVRRLLAGSENARAARVDIDGRGAERVADAMVQGAG